MFRIGKSGAIKIPSTNVRSFRSVLSASGPPLGAASRAKFAPPPSDLFILSPRHHFSTKYYTFMQTSAYSVQICLFQSRLTHVFQLQDKRLAAALDPETADTEFIQNLVLLEEGSTSGALELSQLCKLAARYAFLLFRAPIPIK
jgi:hypothetical protein